MWERRGGCNRPVGAADLRHAAGGFAAVAAIGLLRANSRKLARRGRRSESPRLHYKAAFDDAKGVMQVGMITKINRRTVTLGDGRQDWRIESQLLRPVSDV